MKVNNKQKKGLRKLLNMRKRASKRNEIFLVKSNYICSRYFTIYSRKSVKIFEENGEFWVGELPF